MKLLIELDVTRVGGPPAGGAAVTHDIKSLIGSVIFHDRNVMDPEDPEFVGCTVTSIYRVNSVKQTER